MKSKLSYLELLLYFFVWISANCYCLYKLFIAQSDLYNNNYDFLHSLGELKPGWRLLNRLQDISDIEWSSWKYFIRISWSYLLIQFIVSEIIRKTQLRLLKYWYILSSMIFIVSYMGYRQLIIIMAQPILYASVILFGGKKMSLWIMSLSLLISYNSLKYKYFFWYYLDREDLNDEEVYLILFTIAWIKLRCISYSIDHIDMKEKSAKSKEKIPSTVETLVNMFSYVLYTPLLYIGPIIPYEDFEKSFLAQSEKLASRLRRFICDMFLFTSYTFLLDCAFHYIYFLAMQSDVETIRKLPTIALCGGGLWMGLEFHLKYVISYGTTTAFARLDNMDPPPTPRCIARVHVYSQMWRYFDVGLYKFLVKYIYKPFLRLITKNFNIPKIISKLTASFATFVFIFMWHGTVWNIFVWSILNYLGITLEHFGKVISESNNYKLFKEKVLKTDAMETRFIAALCTPLLALSAISNFYLFAGSKVGNVYFECFINPSFFNSMLVCLSLYGCCHVSIALQDVSSRRDSKPSKIKSN
ncbi:protein-cysteine N-palmitoyltransferase Rasp [Ostrinia furnacalis]|uniref:protein-cysteine N-palmitoyltransferase Rasp n=1 Tax=Ostrinia furnacalis TaxID=93504 RepID=UPI00103D9AFB|nr:protein-cysteine N-palmitoyltransferase Rasp [Ostrinia furnacalis]